MSDLPTVPLGDIVSVKGGKRLPKGSNLQAEPNEHPYIRVRDMGQRYIPDTGLEYVPDEVFPKIQRYIVEENDVIISIVGTIGLVSVIDERFHLASQTENCAKLSGLDRNDALYIYYYLSSSVGQQSIKEATVGAVQAKLPLYNIEKIPVIWPERKERELIVNNLGSLDDKVEHNRQIKQTLEHIANAIFKSWFIDFEPVKAKIEAKQNGQDPERAVMCAISGKTDEELDQIGEEQYQQLATIVSLFPDELVDSEIGEIPEGWGEKRIDQLLELAYGKALKKSDRKTGDVPVYGSGGVTGVHNSYLVEGPGIIVGRKGTVGSLYWEVDNFFPIDTVFYVVPKEGFSFEYIYYLLQTLGLENMNTDAAVPGLNRNNVYRLAVPGHPIGLVEIYSNIVKSFFNQISNNKKENHSLYDLRDTLLPKLLFADLEILEVV